MWIKLSEKFPPIAHTVPNEDVKCVCCEPDHHEVSDYVLVINDRKEIWHARYNHTVGMWETHDDVVVMNFTHWTPVIPLPDEVGEASEIGLVYRNWKGDVEARRIRPIHIFHGSNRWHREPQWLMLAYDLDKEDFRTFALLGIVTVDHPRGQSVT